MHAAARIVIAIAAIEVFPEALDSVSRGTVGVALAIGGLGYLGAQVLVEKRAEGSGRMWMIFLAVTTDHFGDDLLIGAGTTVSANLGITLAIGQIMANIPEGFASLSTFQANDTPPPRSTRGVPASGVSATRRPSPRPRVPQATPIFDPSWSRHGRRTPGHFFTPDPRRVSRSLLVSPMGLSGHPIDA